ncbi:MAG: anthranilate phosphoribosyltransferase [Sphingomonadales bacterium]|nr:anthranilate phosphoribosyltransferase [Sphingomonadales bacterium]
MSEPTRDLKSFLSIVADGGDLTRAEAAQAVDIMMSGAASEVEIAALLMGLRVKGETVDEITGAAEAMRARAKGVSAPAGAVDTCGTGGDGAGTFNISTAAAIIAAAAGAVIAKHGNRSVSSKSGSADVLTALGVGLEVDDAQIARCFDEIGIAFLFAPRHHAAMRHVAPIRQAMGLRTLFNLLGPLANPANTKRQIIGVFDAKWLRPLAQVLVNLGAEKVWLVHGSDGLDELTTTGPSVVVEGSAAGLREFEVTPEEVGLDRAEPEALVGGDAAANAAALTALLAGEAGAYRDIAVLNAAAALVVADRADDLKAGAEMAAQAIDSGRARQTLDSWIALTNG